MGLKRLLVLLLVLVVELVEFLSLLMFRHLFVLVAVHRLLVILPVLKGPCMQRLVFCIEQEAVFVVEHVVDPTIHASSPETAHSSHSRHCLLCNIGLIWIQSLEMLLHRRSHTLLGVR